MTEISKVCALCDLDHPRPAVALCPGCGRYVCNKHARPSGDGSGRLVCQICSEADLSLAGASSPATSHKKNGQHSTLRPFLVFFAGIFSLLLLGVVVADNYKLFLLVKFVFSLFFLVWPTIALVFLWLHYLSKVHTGCYSQSDLFKSVGITLVWLTFLGISLFSLSELSETRYDLYHGPAYGKGAVEGTEIIPQSSGSSHRYIVVRDTRYRVPDRRWFQTLTTGQEIEFLYGPRTHLAFPLQANKEEK